MIAVLVALLLRQIESGQLHHHLSMIVLEQSGVLVLAGDGRFNLFEHHKEFLLALHVRTGHAGRGQIGELQRILFCGVYEYRSVEDVTPCVAVNASVQEGR